MSDPRRDWRLAYRFVRRLDPPALALPEGASALLWRAAQALDSRYAADARDRLPNAERGQHRWPELTWQVWLLERLALAALRRGDNVALVRIYARRQRPPEAPWTRTDPPPRGRGAGLNGGTGRRAEDLGSPPAPGASWAEPARAGGATGIAGVPLVRRCP